jgi:hypothetical protein
MRRARKPNWGSTAMALRRCASVFDFVWLQARRTWGKRGIGPMRPQMHSADPRSLERRLGTVQWLGCIRIPAALKEFLDHYGIRDVAYEAASAAGKRSWEPARGRRPRPWSGRCLVVVDSMRRPRSGLDAASGAARHTPGGQRRCRQWMGASPVIWSCLRKYFRARANSCFSVG